MKKYLWVGMAAVALLAACNLNASSSASSETDTVKYAFNKDRTYEWEINPDPKNTQLALNMLKAFEGMDTAAFKKYLADTLVVYYDGGTFKGNASQFSKLLKPVIDSTSMLHIKMDDWQSVINKNKTEEWVTLWYTEYRTYRNGREDSVQYSDDMLMKNGRILTINEFVRRFPHQ